MYTRNNFSNFISNSISAALEIKTVKTMPLQLIVTFSWWGNSNVSKASVMESVGLIYNDVKLQAISPYRIGVPVRD